MNVPGRIKGGRGDPAIKKGRYGYEKAEIWQGDMQSGFLKILY